MPKHSRCCTGMGGVGAEPSVAQQLGQLLVEAARSYPVRVPLTGALLTHLLRTQCSPADALPFPVQEALLQGTPRPFK